MKYTLVAHRDCAHLLEVAEPFLAAGEGLRSGVWGEALGVRDGTDSQGWTLERDGDRTIVGAVLWSSHSGRLCLTDLPVDAGPTLARELDRLIDSVGKIPLRGWRGPDSAVALLGKAWSRTEEAIPRVKMRTRLYRCEHVTRRFEVAGRLRLATPQDRPLCRTWAQEFGHDTGIITPGHPPLPIDEHLDLRRMFLWEVDGRPVASALWSRATPHSAHISFVFVPRELRGRHYAGAVTVGITRHVLETEGKRFATLFTDTNNPTTNHLYPSLGYEFVQGFSEVELE